MAARPSGNRRALGDIGNIVGALSATNLVAKPQQQQQIHTKNSVQNDTPRKFGTELTLKNQVNRKATEIAIEDDSKQVQKASSTKKRNRVWDVHGHESMPIDKMEEEKEGGENARKKKLERRECVASIDASMSIETADSCLDGNGDLHV